MRRFADSYRRRAAGFTWIDLVLVVAVIAILALMAVPGIQGIPAQEKIVGNLVREVAVRHGAITLTFGNNASKAMEGRKVSIRPAVVPGEPVVPIAWICNDVSVPGGMVVKGKNETDLPPKHLPLECRGPPPK